MNKPKSKMKFSLNRTLSMNQQLGGFNSLRNQTINQQEEYDDDESPKKQIKRQIGIFQQFKIKYDEVRNENQARRKQIQELKRVNKRQQIQILNTNTQFYDKQIKRLRLEVQKFQLNSEDFKHKYFNVQNKKMQLDSSLNIKQQQLRKTIKQLQSQKIHNVQIRHQVKEKEKQYLDIIDKIQFQSNKAIEKYTESQKKLTLSQTELRQTKRALQMEKQNLEKLQKSIKEIELQKSYMIQKLQSDIKNLRISLQQSEKQVKDQKEQIIRLKEKVTQLNHQVFRSKTVLNLEFTKSFEKISTFRSSRILEIQNRRLKEENEELKRQVKQKVKNLKKLEDQLNYSIQKKEIQCRDWEQKYENMRSKKQTIEKSYEKLNLSLNKEVQMLKIKCLKYQNLEQNNINQSKLSFLTFKSNLSSQKHQLLNKELQIATQELFNQKENQLLLYKDSLNQKVQQIFSLKQKIQQVQNQKQNLQNEIIIIKKKSQTIQTNLRAQKQILIFQMNGQIECVKRKLQSSQNKLIVKNKEIKEKDNFICNYMIGRIERQEDVPLILAELQRVFEGDYLQRITDLQEKILQFQQVIEKQMKT